MSVSAVYWIACCIVAHGYHFPVKDNCLSTRITSQSEREWSEAKKRGKMTEKRVEWREKDVAEQSKRKKQRKIAVSLTHETQTVQTQYLCLLGRVPPSETTISSVSSIPFVLLESIASGLCNRREAFIRWKIVKWEDKQNEKRGDSRRLHLSLIPSLFFPSERRQDDPRIATLCATDAESELGEVFSFKNIASSQIGKIKQRPSVFPSLWKSDCEDEEEGIESCCVTETSLLFTKTRMRGDSPATLSLHSSSMHLYNYFLSCRSSD